MDLRVVVGVKEFVLGRSVVVWVKEILFGRSQKVRVEGNYLRNSE